MRAAWDRYWFDFSVLRARLVLWRVLFFGLLAADFWLILLEHAPRFGAGGFNVSQLPFLDPWLPLPRPEVVGPLYLAGGLLSLCAALGVATRRCLWLLAPVYAGIYLWSQSDSYQHHYLLSLLLVLLCFVPEEAWRLPRPGESPHVRSWAMRLVYVQIGLMYAWTAVTKHTPVWLDGTTLQQLLGCEPREQLRSLAAGRGTTLEAAVGLAAVAVMIGEYVAGLVYLVRPLWVVGFFLIPLFHVGVEWLDLDIELFSFYMIGTNLLLLAPDRWVSAATSGLVSVRAALPAFQALPGGRGLVLRVGTAALLVAAGLVIPYEGAVLAAVLLAGAGLFVFGRHAAPSTAAGLVIAAGAMVVTAHVSDAPYTYYRQWGGFLRRQGDEAGAMEKYGRANEVAGERPARHLQLARLHLKNGEAERAAELLDEDLRRQTAARPARPPTTAEGWLRAGKTERALADALTLAAEVFPKVGRAAEVPDLGRRREEAVRAAREAFRRNMELDPACGLGRMELQRLGGGRGAEPAGEP